MNERIYRYVVRYDTGTAPNPFAGWCSLAICKPAIRRSAKAGDWIIGLRSRRPDEVIYVMQVEEVLGFADYWSDVRFLDKRPERCVSSDNIYRPDQGGHLVQVPNRVHFAQDIQRDLGGQRVLVGRRFWYFGDGSPQLPTELAHLVHASQGHSVDVGRRPDDGNRLREWLGHWPIGIHGSPLDAGRLQLPASFSAGSSNGIGIGCAPAWHHVVQQPVKPKFGCA